MMQLIEAAIRPQSQAQGSSRDSGSRFAILPQQSDEELLISKVHSKLDSSLSFLQNVIGYTLLDDLRPRRGGGVKITYTAAANGAAAAPRGSRSVRFPQEEPGVSAEDEEALQVIRFSPDTAKYAHYPDDLVLVWRFTNILSGNLQAESGKLKHETLYKCVLQGVRLMHLCDYNYSDVVLTLAYASVYFTSTFHAIGHKMSDYEAAHVCVLLIYLAHSFVLDETCPLRCWQKHIFRKYCTLKVLDAALFRLFQMRGFRLRISEEEERRALSVLLCTTNGLDVMISLSNGPNKSTASTVEGSRPGSTASSASVAHSEAPILSGEEAVLEGSRRQKEAARRRG